MCGRYLLTVCGCGLGALLRSGSGSGVFLCGVAYAVGCYCCIIRCCCIVLLLLRSVLLGAYVLYGWLLLWCAAAVCCLRCVICVCGIWAACCSGLRFTCAGAAAFPVSMRVAPRWLRFAFAGRGCSALAFRCVLRCMLYCVGVV
jgi:hypothetical protein